MMVEKVTDREKGSISKDTADNNITTSNFTNTHRDIYKREQRIRYWINRVKHDSIPEEDRADILKFMEYQKQEAVSSLRMVRCINALLLARRIIKTRFKDATKEDIKQFVDYLEDNNYTLSTQHTYKSIIKKFYKVVYGNDKYYPEAVVWIKNRVSKDKRMKEEQLSYEQYLTEQEIKLLIDTANTVQRKAFIAVGYETGARPEELLNIKVKDILFDSKGARVILRGKTVERVTRVIAYVSLLRQWLSVHPYKDDPNAYLWLSEASNHKWRPIGLRSVEKFFEETMKRAGIKKQTRLYILRHSRTTHLRIN